MTREEAIKEIKTWDFLDNDEKKILETLIPELKESEDEKIRKDLMEWFEEFPDMIWRGHYKKDVLTWLEKQAPKPKWSEEDEKMLNHIIGLLEGLPNLHNWLKSIKERIEG